MKRKERERKGRRGQNGTKINLVISITFYRPKGEVIHCLLLLLILKLLLMFLLFSPNRYVLVLSCPQKKFTHFEAGQTDRRTDGQTDRRTDRHDVTLEATPSKFFLMGA